MIPAGRLASSFSEAEKAEALIVQDLGDNYRFEDIAQRRAVSEAVVVALFHRQRAVFQAKRVAESHVTWPELAPTNVCPTCIGRWITGVMAARKAATVEHRAVTCAHSLDGKSGTDDYRIAYLTKTSSWIQMDRVDPATWNAVYADLVAFADARLQKVLDQDQRERAFTAGVAQAHIAAKRAHDIALFLTVARGIA